jgi:hypothetical protein
VPGFANGAIIDCSIRQLEDKIQQLHTNSSRRRTEAADDATTTLISRRAIDPHLGYSIVAMCVPKACPIPGLLVSCSRQKTIVVWYSGSEYTSYNAHADGARCPSFCGRALYFSRCSLTLPSTSRSCIAAISTVVISGDWEGAVLFQDVESKTQLSLVKGSHPGGVTVVTAFSSRDDEEFFAGLASQVCMFMFSVDALAVTTGMDKTCKLWTHYGVLLNVLPVAQAVVIGQIYKAVLQIALSHSLF